MMVTSSADSGKYAEGEVKKYLKLLESSHMGFTANKNPDAYTAGGRFVPVAGDFQAFHKLKLSGHVELPAALKAVIPYDGVNYHFSRNFIIEVKGVKHDFRLPAKNYSSDKIARVEKRVRAGTEAVVLICHWPKTDKEAWRLVPHEVFLDQSQPSWDLRPYPIVDWKRALSDFLGVLP
jgi:hypothetical protein